MKRKLIKTILSGAGYPIDPLFHSISQLHNNFCDLKIPLDEIEEMIGKKFYFQIEDKVSNLVLDTEKCAFEAGFDFACILFGHEPIYDCLEEN